MAYQIRGLTSLHEFLVEMIVYRNLIPADTRLPSVDDLREPLDLEQGYLPRKAEPAYGKVVAEMLRQARILYDPSGAIQRLLYIGDTRLNDGTAYENLCAAGGWSGWAFIGRDTPDQAPTVEIEGTFYVANRWSLLPDFLQFVQEQGFVLDQETAVVIDVDKTAIGARGRNDQVINEARVEGVRLTVADLLGPNFDQKAFRRAYDELNQAPYYDLTADNQDYLAYICLILGAGLFELESLIAQVKAGSMAHFADFIGAVQRRRSELAKTGLTSIHDDVWSCFQERDPTPFKAFRYNEYLTTSARFGSLSGEVAEEVLRERIAITQEVREAAMALRARGALVFGVSDKPDEASVPSETQARMGMKPLHHLETLAVGDAQKSPDIH